MSDALNKLKSRMASGEELEADVITVHQGKNFRVRVGELKEAIKAHPDHPSAQAYAKGIRNLKDDHMLVVDQTDLEALIDGKEVLVNEDRVGGARILTKSLGKTEAKAPTG